MAGGTYAAVTPITGNALASAMFMATLMQLIKTRAENGNLHIAAGEPYTKLTDPSDGFDDVQVSEEMDSGTKLFDLAFGPWVIDEDKGSTWVIACPAEHQFHVHDGSEESPQVSKRYLQFVSDKGMEAHICPVDKDMKATGAMEIYDIPTGIVELRFDGTYAHKFVPKEGGKIVAIATHPEDTLKGKEALGRHTHTYEDVEFTPPEDSVKRIIVNMPEIAVDIMAEAMSGFDQEAIKRSQEQLKNLPPATQLSKWVNSLMSRSGGKEV